MPSLDGMRKMQPNGYKDRGKEDEGPLLEETHVKVLEVLERRPSGHEVHAISEPGIYVVRARLIDASSCESGDRVEVEGDKIGPLSLLRYRDLSNESTNSLVDAIKEVINENPDGHLSFYNRANNISLKMHAFQLLPGIGKSTAQDWVQKRGPNGWIDLAEVSEKLGIDAVSLLAERYEKELIDPSEVPSLLELLVRTSA
ncbi:MAG TPA: DUF655 domain-containing protein [Candidatus Poseidoniales archaeon]|jgi:predicted nucleic acid-binding OB-fold protein|nr:MAG TPA: DUF655 domain-containing protein [Candidatus Poseidoniales archaeon]|tara:strand:+ start:811 stop:1410 length:600 start_codon:yes stop_codon:yes gene_type:complete